MMNRSRLAFIASFALAIIPSAFAEKFANQFTEFELPPSWACQLEGAEWVCQSTNELKKKEAIIVLAAKLKGDADSIDQYLKYLNSVKTFTAPNGKPMKSNPRKTTTTNLNGQIWADSLHLESEIPGFFTRYLATVKDDIAVLITYSVAKEKYQSYVPEFENMVRTLKVFRKPGGLIPAPDTPPVPVAGTGAGVEPIAPPLPNAQVDVPEIDKPAAPKKSPIAALLEDPTLMLAVAALALIGFFIFKKRKG